MEIREGEFRFAEDEQEAHKEVVLARRLSETRGTPSRYKINQRSCAFLEIDDTAPHTS